MNNAVIVYCSPGGSTRHVGHVISTVLEQNGINCLTVDLDLGIDDTQNVINRLKEENSCLFIGSPVYVNRPVPPVMKFISALPQDNDFCAVPFVTWGGASSGIALQDLGQALAEKGCKVLGAGKVLALHTMMWRFDQPLGQNHPDDNDDQIIRDLVGNVIQKIKNGSPSPVSLNSLAYQPENVQTEMQKVTLEKAKANMPKKDIDENKCTQCGQCADYCPVQAITLNPFPEFNNDCICCYKCVRDCPEDAFTTDLSPLDARIRERAEKFNEQPVTEIFV